MSSEPVTITAASARSNLSRSPADRSTVDSSAFAQGHGEAKPAISPHTRFVARQPILTREEKVFGYELLFRDGVEDYFRATDPDAASRNTLDSSILLGLDVLCGGQRAFINCRSEEHTSELQSPCNLVCRLLLEKKKRIT